MPAASAQAARRAAAAPARTARPRPRPATRRSGSATARSRGSAARVARPRSAMPARLVPLAVGRTAVAVSGLAESGLVYRLTRGRLWIGFLTTLLVGIVSLNVLALSLNASSSKVGGQADELKREISALRAQIATNGASNERIQAAAATLGLIMPEPGAVGYLSPGDDDAALAARRLASGELTSLASYVTPLAPVSAPTAVPAAPAATEPAVAEPAQTAPETDTAAAAAPETTSRARADRLAGAGGADRRRRWGSVSALSAGGPPGPGQGLRTMIERRVGLLFACFLLLFVIAIGRAAWVQGIQGGGLAADAQSQQTQTVTIPGRRGRILDRHGRELAVSEDAEDVIATPYQVEDPARAARRLAPLLNVSEAEILAPAGRSILGLRLPGSPGWPTGRRPGAQAEAGRHRHGAVEPAGLPGGQARGSRDRDRGG